MLRYQRAWERHGMAWDLFKLACWNDFEKGLPSYPRQAGSECNCISYVHETEAKHRKKSRCKTTCFLRICLSPTVATATGSCSSSFSWAYPTWLPLRLASEDVRCSLLSNLKAHPIPHDLLQLIMQRPSATSRQTLPAPSA